MVKRILWAGLVLGPVVIAVDRTSAGPTLVFLLAALALIPLAIEVPALVSLAILTAVLVALIAFETIHYAEARDRIRHQLTLEE